jgi:hypothetical protein
MAFHKATPHTDWLHRAVDYHNLESLRYRYSVAPAKAFPTAFANHTSVTTTSYPSLAGFTRLSDGGSRDSVVKRYVATSDDANVGVDGKTYPVSKRSIVLVEHLPDGIYRLSIPLGDSIDGDEADADSVGDPVDLTHTARM